MRQPARLSVLVRCRAVVAVCCQGSSKITKRRQTTRTPSVPALKILDTAGRQSCHRHHGVHRALSLRYPLALLPLLPRHSATPLLRYSAIRPPYHRMTPASPPDATHASVSRALPASLVLLLAGGAGLSVASLYYAQPMLGVLGTDMNASAHDVGLIPTFTQLGYALGILLLAPLMFPIARQLGINDVHYAMVVVTAMNIGLMMPPIGVGFYVACRIGNVSPDEAMGAIWPYIVALIVGLLVIAYVPTISTFVL